ncbi:tumor necrosis factor receptor superfamily member 6B-like isoform X2 [Thunnus maccoyii]|nr:tumor necrosis factor receptor superfamily member 6B-like isoform X2 [Thunnus maccoyii]XP_042291080.1 tumor necrosis factor receptor superfamily member 6B-like isoform X2 [Thunnus maccoyii]
MFLPLLSVLLLSQRCALVNGVNSVYGVNGELPTYRSTDPTTGKQVVCDKCPPGTYLLSRCTMTQKSVCAPCPRGSYTELWNYIGRCLRCGVCGKNQVEKRVCSADSDCQCECKQGYYYKYDMCLRHRECPSGEGVQTKGTPHADTVCHVCPNGTYSACSSAEQSCMQHQNCEASGLRLVLKGSNWHDSVCSSCEANGSKDGAEYLREILPAFFIHQRIGNKRLRQIVHRLSSQNSKTRNGTLSGLDISDLHAWINAWVASATAMQLRDLPTVVSKIAHSAGEKLQNKLQRIDSLLNELCEEVVVNVV